MKHINIFNFVLAICFTFLGCTSSKSDKPSNEKMKDCLSNELLNKAIIEGYDQQDGLTREKDGVKYYEGYFNAEIKFIANTDAYKAGDRYKIIKGTLSFMKTENGWNCQQFDFSSANLVKIKEEGEDANHVNGTDPKNNLQQTEIQTTSNQPSQPTQTNSDNFNYYAKGFGRYPETSNRIIEYSDISNLSSRDLKIMRNEIFARHGYIFKTSDMVQYFSEQSWYRPLHADVSSKLTDIEKKNVDFIKSYEH